MALEFKIKKGLSTNLIDTDGNPLITLQEGCWYLCTDTAELYVAVLIDEVLTLRKANDEASSFDELRTAIEGKATVEFIPTKENLPSIGVTNIVYFIEKENRSCSWNGTNYIWSAPEVPHYNEIRTINGGSATAVLD